MSGYGYGFRGYPTYNDLAPQTDIWRKTSSASDHVRKLVDAEGRKHPIVYNPGYNAGTTITKTETVVRQQVHLPSVTEYEHSSHTKVEPLNHHGHVEDKWHDSSSQVRGHVEDKWHKSSSPYYWSQSPNSTGYHGHGYGRGDGYEYGHGHGDGNTGYGDYNDKSSKDWHKPSGNTIRKGDYDGHYHNNDIKMEPTMINSGGWARPNPSGWAAPPDTSLSTPTNDIGKAMEFLKEAAKHTSVTTSPHSRYTVPITTGPRMDDYGETINGREAAKRYGNLPPSQSEEKYTKTINSREAARKYKGASVPV